MMSLVSVLGCGTWFFPIEEQLYCKMPRSVASVSLTSFRTVYLLTIRARAALESAARCSHGRSSSLVQAVASASGQCEGTICPVLPTMIAESPTSVTTHGTPQAMASPMAFENPSP